MIRNVPPAAAAIDLLLADLRFKDFQVFVDAARVMRPSFAVNQRQVEKMGRVKLPARRSRVSNAYIKYSHASPKPCFAASARIRSISAAIVSCRSPADSIRLAEFSTRSSLEVPDHVFFSRSGARAVSSGE